MLSLFLAGATEAAAVADTKVKLQVFEEAL